MQLFQIDRNKLFILVLGATVFWGGCTFLLNTDGLIQECVSEIDCADGFYCDEGACLPGEAPPPFIPEEPNIPDFNEDAGVSPTSQADGGTTLPGASGDAGLPQPPTVDAGAVPIETDAGTQTTSTVFDAGAVTVETHSDAGTTTTNNTADAGSTEPVSPQDSGTALSQDDAGQPDAPIDHADAGTSSPNDAG